MESEATKLSESDLIEAHRKHLNTISERNKRCIPANIYKNFQAYSA